MYGLVLVPDCTIHFINVLKIPIVQQYGEKIAHLMIKAWELA